MNKLRNNQSGFSAVELILIILVVGLLGTVGFLVYKNQKKTPVTPTNTTTPAASKTATPVTDTYAGWETGTSSRAKFTIKYPSNWKYTSTVGSKDGVEHIEITGPKIVVRADSYSGKDPLNGGSAGTTCSDCTATLKTQDFTAGKLGVTNLNTVTYKLDSGSGNALVLESPKDTYYIVSPSTASVTTTFRSISVLDSLQAYQSETPAQFTANSDYQTAVNILKSVNY